MESVASASSSTTDPHRNHHRFRPAQPVADRIHRALRHRLRLLHRSDSSFFVLGATGNVYTVTLTANPSCTCPDRTTPCKHILFVYLRVLGVPLEDACLRRRALRPCQLRRLLGTPTLEDSVAGARLRRRFHQLFFQGVERAEPPTVEIEEGTACPVCMEEMETGEAVVACGTCRNAVHEECLMRWKRTRGRRGACCVICRARWRDVRGGGSAAEYVNLGAYVGDDDGGGGGGGRSLCSNSSGG